MSHKIVLANGVFDLLHAGHLEHLIQAKSFGDMLIVSITRDASVNKGAGRPVYQEGDRASLVKALSCVDGVVLCDGLLDALQTVRPHILVKGKDYADGGINELHLAYCKTHRIEVRYTDTPKISAFDELTKSRQRLIFATGGVGEGDVGVE